MKSMNLICLQKYVFVGCQLTDQEIVSGIHRSMTSLLLLQSAEDTVVG